MAQSPKRILIVSYYFGPQNAIGAVRPTKLAKYLARMGHEVTVICGIGMTGLKDPTLERDMRELKDVHVVREWNPLRAWKARKPGTGRSRQTLQNPPPRQRKKPQRRPRFFIARRTRRICIYGGWRIAASPIAPCASSGV